MTKVRALAALVAAALLAAACSSGGGPGTVITRTVDVPATSSAPASSVGASSSALAASTSAAKPKPKPRTVGVSSLISDGATYGVGMPIVLYFSPLPTDSAAFTRAVRVTVNGQPADGSWFWEQPTADEVNSHIIEAHYRLEHYWPRDSTVHVSIPIGGLSAGNGLVFGDKLTSLSFHIGDSHISYVDGKTLRMRVTSNGKVMRTFNVSLGEAQFPTYDGTKLVMQKGEDVPGTGNLRPNGTVLMSGPGYTDDPVQWSVRITRSGEYVHAAPWNSQIGQASTSHGCTNLTTADAKWYYQFAQVGDVVHYGRTGGKLMPVWDGFGDWNVTWLQWQAGGLLVNH